MRHLLRGFTAGLSLFRTAPASAVSAVVALALGLGFSTTMFGIVHGGTRTLPVDEPHRIIAVQHIARESNAATPVSTGLDLHTWRSAGAGLAELEGFLTASFNMADESTGPPERVNGAFVTPGSFALLGVAPIRGRGFTMDDSREGASVLISHHLWSRRFAGAASPTPTIRLDGTVFTVVGVMPEGFGFPIHADVWLPYSPGPDDTRAVQVWGRLNQSSTGLQLEAALSTATRALAEQLSESHRGLDAHVVPFTELETPPEVIAGLYVLLCAVTGVLVIACVNVANLFLARAAGRARDTAVRLALGASRRVLLAEHAGEALALATPACLLGIAMAYAGTAVFAANTGHIIEAYWVHFSVDAAVLTWSTALALAAAIAAAVLPAWRAARMDVVHTLRDGGGATQHSASRTSRVLVTAQITFACALLALTLLLGRSALSLQQRDWPFDANAILSTNVSIPLSAMNEPAHRLRLLRDLQTALESATGGRAALTSALPGSGAGSWQFSLEGPAGPPAGATALTMVSEGFFATLNTSATRGRLFDERDREGAPLVAVVNESFVRRYASDRDPLGLRIAVGTRELTVVGVVPDLMPGDIQDERQDGIYASIHQLRPYGVRVIAAGGITPRTLRHAIDTVDRDLPLYETYPLREAALRDKRVLTVLSGLFSLFGVGALTLTAVGLYSVMALLVAVRTREFGIRVALGATRQDLLRLVVSQGGRQVIVGLTLGMALGLAMTQVFSNAVEAVRVEPAGILIGIAAAIAGVSALALLLPTLTAMRVNPVVALRNQ